MLLNYWQRRQIQIIFIIIIIIIIIIMALQPFVRPFSFLILYSR
jgi:hypothetical protein